MMKELFGEYPILGIFRVIAMIILAIGFFLNNTHLALAGLFFLIFIESIHSGKKDNELEKKIK